MKSCQEASIGTPGRDKVHPDQKHSLKGRHERKTDFWGLNDPQDNFQFRVWVLERKVVLLEKKASWRKEKGESSVSEALKFEATLKRKRHTDSPANL